MRRREVLVAAAAGQGVGGIRSARAQAFPSRPIRLVVPFPPGGSNDVIARVVSEKLGARWNQGIIVENRPGAGGNIGAAAVARAAPDGHTWLLFAKPILTVNLHILRGSLDPVRDLSYVARLFGVPVVLVVHPRVPARDVRDLLDLARARPGTLAYPSSGIGSLQHLAAVQLVGDTMTHVPYRGANELMPDLLGDRVQVFAGAVNSLIPPVRSGALRALAVLHPTRVPTLPDVPTIAEAGFPGAEFDTWGGLAMPAGTPWPIIEQTHAAVAMAFAEREVVTRLAEQGIEVGLQSPAEMTRTVQQAHASDGALIARLGIHPE